jgi:hypothetical protein
MMRRFFQSTVKGGIEVPYVRQYITDSVSSPPVIAEFDNPALDGSLMILMTRRGAANSITPPSGWTTLYNVSGIGHRFGVFYRIKQSGDPDTWTFNGGGSALMPYHFIEIANVNQTTPFFSSTITNASSVTSIQVGTAAIDPPDKSLVFAVMSATGTTASWSCDQSFADLESINSIVSFRRTFILSDTNIRPTISWSTISNVYGLLFCIQ